MKTEPIQIECWSTSRSGGPYDAPELTSLRLTGRVTGHPLFPTGEKITTSAVVSVKGRLVTTESGRVYRLGRPSRKWTAWLRTQGKPYSSKEPIRVIREEGARG